MAELVTEGLREELHSSMVSKALLTKGPYRLASGRLSRYYLNMKPLLNDEGDLSLISRLLLEMIPKATTAVGGLATGSISLSTGIFLENKSSRRVPRPLKGFWVREGEKDHGLGLTIEGDLTSEDRVVIVDDVTTTGSSVMKAIEAVKSKGVEILRVISVVDRGEGAREKIVAENLEFSSIFGRNDFLKD